MNRMFGSRWNAALGAWVAVSEHCRARGKPARSATAAVIVATVAWAGPAQAVTCGADANGSYLAGWTQTAPNPYVDRCNEVPATTGAPTVLGSSASWYVLVRSRLDPPNDNVTIGDTNVSYTGANGFSLIGNQYLTHGSITLGNVTANLSNSGSGGGINGLGTHSTVPINGGNFNLTVNSIYTGGNGGGGVGSYGVLAGSSVISGESAIANNGKFSTITLDNATISQTAIGGTTQPVLNNGLRAIQGAYLESGNGSSGKIEVKGLLDMTLTGPRIEGIYVSGSAADAGGNEAVSQVVLNNSTIKMVKSAGTT